MMVAVWQHGRVARSTNTQFAVAVHVLTYLAGGEPARPVSSDELAESTNVNPVYVRRVLGPLRNAGLVRSRPGVHGGWELAVDARDVTLAQVWRLLQGSDPVLGMHGPDAACPVGRRVQTWMGTLDRAVADAVAAELERFTVHDLVARDVSVPVDTERARAVSASGPGPSQSESVAARPTG